MEEAPHKRILIVSHTFPPGPGVGGRRWAKFAKYFSRQGHHVEVLTAEKNHDTESPWTSDVVGITTHTYPHFYPGILERKPAGIADKVKYRLALFKMKQQSNGTPYDRALKDKPAFLKVLSGLLTSGHFEYVVVTGAPFNLLDFTAELIPSFREVVFVADFRDPWTWGETFGYKFLTAKRMEHERIAENRVVDTFDLITSPWPEIVNVLNDRYPGNAQKLELLPHGYDPEDLPSDKGQKANNHSVERMIYGGTIYPDTIPQLQELTAFVSKNSEKFQLDIYSRDRPDTDSNVPGVHFHKPLASKKYFQVLSEADYLILLVPGSVKDGILSKLYELAALDIPIVVLGRKGSLSKFIEDNKLGIFKKQNEDMASFFTRLAHTREVTVERSWLNKHTIDFISRSFVERLKSIAK